MKKYIVASLLFLFTSVAFAGTELVGTTSSNFIKIPPFARAVGMGEAFTAVSDGTYGLYYNPAGISSSIGYEVQMTHISWFQGINYEFLSLVTPSPINDKGKIGAAIAWFQVDELTRTEALASYDPVDLAAVDYSQFNETFSPYDYSVILGYSRDVNDNFSVGATFKLMSENIDSFSGFNITADMGLIYKAVFNGSYMRLGGVVSNLGSSLKLDRTDFDSPVLWKFGMSEQMKLFNGTVLVSAQAVIHPDYDPLYSLGAEYWILDMAALRAGYKLGAFNQFTVGAGVRWSGWELDYGFVKYDELGNTHRISLLYSWGTPPVKLKVTPAVFSPNNDRVLDTATFLPSVRMAEKIKSMKLNIYSHDGKKLLGFVPVTDKNAKQIPWNGSADGFSTLPDGVYRASVSVEYDTGISDSNMVNIEIDNTPPEMRLDADPKLLKPGRQDALIIPATFTFFAADRNRIAKWQFVIWDYNRKVFAVESGAGDPPLSYIWDGRGVNNQYVRTGEVYYCSLHTWDTVGNHSRINPLALVVLLREIKLTFASDAIFDIGEADVKISAYSILKHMKSILDQNPESEIIVQGHTDNRQPLGIKYKNNEELSKARAEAVKFFMINLLEYDKKRIKTEGLGDSMPIADNSTPEGRQINRRVEIIIRSTIYK
ncbi:MAG: PorV/PorQ family protein [Spirochaetia bacterium]|nr:PorV/PorQ family protein [Spirochaetia bacterium]